MSKVIRFLALAIIYIFNLVSFSNGELGKLGYIWHDEFPTPLHQDGTVNEYIEDFVPSSDYPISLPRVNDEFPVVQEPIPMPIPMIYGRLRTELVEEDIYGNYGEMGPLMNQYGRRQPYDDDGFDSDESFDQDDDVEKDEDVDEDDDSEKDEDDEDDDDGDDDEKSSKKDKKKKKPEPPDYSDYEKYPFFVNLVLDALTE